MTQPTAPRDPAAFVAALQAGDPILAASVAVAMLADRRPLGRQWQAIARFAVTESEWTIAVKAMRRYVADDPRALDRQLALAETLGQAGRVADAVAVLTPLAQITPTSAEVQHFLGVARVELGERDAGLESLQTALRLRPGSGPTWLSLAQAHRFTRGDAVFEALAAADFARAGAADRAAWLYARGKAFDDLGEYDAAFAAFAEGARLVARERRYDVAADRRAALGSIQDLSADWLSAHAAPGASRCLFVTGKPRSGTTLVERILASHSTVVDGGEVNLIGPAAAATGLGDDAAMRRAARSRSDPWGAFRARHAYLVDQRFPAPGLVVDKSLNTSRMAALVRLALPDAPVIWLRRDPLDTAWSSFRTYFARGVEWSFDLTAMGAYHAVEDRLHAFWAEAYGDRMLTIDYADLVERPDATIARLLRHCGLGDEPQVRDFHLSGRAVQTASVGQVNQPINRAGLDTAGPYRAHLGAYERAYAEARRALGLS
ncbi:MAG TPA: sulfotransferase [Sphingomonas sp.]